jgi:putative serine protease PepD
MGHRGVETADQGHPDEAHATDREQEGEDRRGGRDRRRRVDRATLLHRCRRHRPIFPDGRNEPSASCSTPFAPATVRGTPPTVRTEDSTAMAHTTLDPLHCTLCGRAQTDGRCPHCDLTTTAPLPHVASPRHLVQRGKLPALIVAMGVVLALLLASVLWRSANGDAGLRRLADRQHRELVGLRRELTQTRADVGRLNARVSELDVRSAGQLDPTAVANRVRPSVFTVEVTGAEGSAFVLASVAGRSTLLTNFHVVADEWNNGRRAVEVRQGDATFAGTIENVSQADDLATISVAERFPVLERSTTPPNPGDPVVVVGSPMGLGGTVTSGIVSAIRQEDGRDFIQFSAPISPGSSGGPVVDRAGRVLGIAEAKFVDNGAEGLSFAVPINKVCGLLAC